MFTLPPSVRIFVANQPVDMRRSIDGLAALVVDLLRSDPYSGHLFVFYGKRRDRLKILVWDRSGFWLFYKRLEKLRFQFPAGDGVRCELEGTQLALLLDGLDPTAVKKLPRFIPPPPPDFAASQPPESPR